MKKIVLFLSVMLFLLVPTVNAQSEQELDVGRYHFVGANSNVKVYFDTKSIISQKRLNYDNSTSDVVLVWFRVYDVYEGKSMETRLVLLQYKDVCMAYCLKDGAEAFVQKITYQMNGDILYDEKKDVLQFELVAKEDELAQKCFDDVASYIKEHGKEITDRNDGVIICQR